MSDLPAGWRSATLGEVATWGSGGTPKSGDPRFYGGDLPWAVIGDLRDGPVSETATSITDEGLRSSSAKLVPAGSVLVAMYGSIGKLGVTARPMATNQAIAFAIPNRDAVEVRYLFYYLLSQRSALAAAGKGATQRNIGQGVLKAWPIPVPPLTEQRRIVDALEDRLSRLSAGEQYGSAALTRLNKMRGGVLEAACAGRLATTPGLPVSRQQVLDLRATRYPVGTRRGRPQPATATLSIVPAWPEHWARLSLEEATDPVRTISYGILKPGPDMVDGIPYVRVINMRGDVLDVGGLHRTTPAIAAQYGRSTLAVGDVLISIRGTYGRVVEVPDSLAGANITQDTARLAFLDPVLPSFAAVYLRSPGAQQFLKAVARGVAVKGVNITDLRAMPFPVPPISEQAEIVTWVDEQLTAMDDVIRSTRATIARGRVLRRSLLSAAFSGALTSATPPSFDEETSRV